MCVHTMNAQAFEEETAGLRAALSAKTEAQQREAVRPHPE